MKRTRITKRVKELAHGLIYEGIGYEWPYLRIRVLDEKDEEYTYEEYEKAMDWISKKFD